MGNCTTSTERYKQANNSWQGRTSSWGISAMLLAYMIFVIFSPRPKNLTHNMWIFALRCTTFPPKCTNSYIIKLMIRTWFLRVIVWSDDQKDWVQPSGGKIVHLGKSFLTIFAVSPLNTTHTTKCQKELTRTPSNRKHEDLPNYVLPLGFFLLLFSLFQFCLTLTFSINHPTQSHFEKKCTPVILSLFGIIHPTLSHPIQLLKLSCSSVRLSLFQSSIPPNPTFEIVLHFLITFPFFNLSSHPNPTHKHKI